MWEDPDEAGDTEPTVEKKQQTPNGLTLAKPHQDLIPNLISVSASLRSEILNQAVWNILVSAMELI